MEIPENLFQTKCALSYFRIIRYFTGNYIIAHLLEFSIRTQKIAKIVYPPIGMQKKKSITKKMMQQDIQEDAAKAQNTKHKCKAKEDKSFAVLTHHYTCIRSRITFHKHS